MDDIINDLTDANIQNLENTLQLVTEMKDISKGAKGIEHSTNLILSIIDKMKTIMFGAPWKLTLKRIPIFDKFYDLLSKYNSISKNINHPFSIITSQMQSIINDLLTLKETKQIPAKLSGNVWSIISVIPDSIASVNKYCELLPSIANNSKKITDSMSKLENIKGIGLLAKKMAVPLSGLYDRFKKNEEIGIKLFEHLNNIGTWLHPFQEKIRAQIISEIDCQFSIKKGLLSRENCSSKVQWYDDEAEAKCSKCGFTVCEKHRVKLEITPGNPLRNKWNCLICAKKSRN